MLKAKKEIGKQGAFESLCAVAEAVQLGIKSLDAEMVSSWAQVKIDRAKRLLPYTSEILTETWKVYRKSCQNLPKILEESQQNVQEISQESQQNLVDFTPSNPRGRIKEEREIEEKEKEKIDQIENDFEEWYKAYPRKVAKGAARKAYKAARKTVPADILLDGVSRYRDSKPAYAEWKHPATWLNGECWMDQNASEEVPPALISRADKLLSFPVIKNRYDGYTIPTSEISRREDMPDDLYWQGKALALSEFEGVS